MGGIRRNRPKKPASKRTDQERANAEGRGAGYKDIVKENALFEAFYREQKLCDGEEEFKAMMDAFRRDLPASFRITGFRSQVNNLQRHSCLVSI